MKRLIPFLLVLFFSTPILFSQITVMDDFEDGPGHFAFGTMAAGQSTGLINKVGVVDSSTAQHGSKLLKVLLIDDPASTNDIVCRFWSGNAASPSANVPLGNTGYVGYWLKVNRTYLRTAITIDESSPAPAATEFSDTVDVIGDGQWHLYQWNFEDTLKWFPWVGASNGKIENTPTVDAIWFFAPNSFAHNDTITVNLDYVAWNASGQLPVELVSFTASAQYNKVDLKWITATEINNAGFEVERKAENGAFEKIAYVEGKGTTTEVTPYTYTDVVDQVGVYYYRLKQVDYDGTYEYSSLVKVNVTTVPNTYSLEQNYPNPFNPATVINYTIAEAGMVTLSVYNTLGEKVGELVNQVQQAGPHQVEFNASSLASGTYIYSLNVNGNSISKKMVLMK